MKWLLKLLVKFYRYFISPMLPQRCIYYPSCSEYALEALETHGAIKGFILTVKRILRCNPMAKGGYDPVPEKGCWHNGVKPIANTETTSDSKASCCGHSCSEHHFQDDNHEQKAANNNAFSKTKLSSTTNEKLTTENETKRNDAN
ncbi:membrane protein insertion efficiency factor YidD [Oceanospirillum beijerinckii]|uniref:membrane protein insertion efficiency factor YidD n=1 Tax=Oceanospirillum beijerinckii TaxID=64976 RepID=UPI0004274792